MSKRESFGKKSLAAFCDSLLKYGFHRPVFLGADGTLADGRKRIAAALSLGDDSVPFVVAPTPLVFDDDLLISKLLCKEGDFFDEADSFFTLTSKYLYSQESVALALGKSQSYVANKLRLLKFTEDERRMIREGALCERHCRALLRIADDVARREALEVIISSGLNVGATEDYISRFTPPRDVRRAVTRDLDAVISKYAASVTVSSASAPYDPETLTYVIRFKH